MNTNPEDRYDRDDYTGDWWNDHPGSAGILSRIRAVEQERAAGAFRSQIDYHAAFWDAEGVTPPGDRQRVSIARSGLSAAAPLAIGTERFTTLGAEAPEWAVGSDGLITLNAQRPQGKKAARWNSRHPIIEALTGGDIDSAITLNGLATTGSVTIPMTSKTLDTIYVRPELLHRVRLSWQCLRLRHDEIIALPTNTRSCASMNPGSANHGDGSSRRSKTPYRTPTLPSSLNSQCSRAPNHPPTAPKGDTMHAADDFIRIEHTHTKTMRFVRLEVGPEWSASAELEISVIVKTNRILRRESEFDPSLRIQSSEGFVSTPRSLARGR